jgi:hypothetical protein
LKKTPFCFLSPARSALFKGPCSESSPAETMNSDEYHDHLALGQLVTGTVGNHNFQYWVAHNPKNKMNFARDYEKKYEDIGKTKKNKRSTQNFHGYFITPDGERCIIVDENNLSEFRTPQTPKEIKNANRLLAKYKKKYPGTTPEIHLREKENKIANGEWKRGNRRGQQRQGPPPGSVLLPRTPPPPVAGFPLPAGAFSTNAVTVMPPPPPSLPSLMPPNLPNVMPPSLPNFMPTQPLPQPLSGWNVMPVPPQYTTVNTPGNGNLRIIPVTPLYPLQPRGNNQPFPVTAAHGGHPRPSHPAHSDTTTFEHVRYPSEFYMKVVEKTPIFDICNKQLARLNQALNSSPTKHFETPFERLAELIKEILVEWDNKTKRFDPAKIGKADVKVQQRLEAFLVMHCIHYQRVNDKITFSHHNLDKIAAKDFTVYYTALKKVFEYNESDWKSLTNAEKKTSLQKVFIGLQHGIGFTLLQLHEAEEKHKSAMSAITALTSSLHAAGVPPAPMGHTSRASEDVSDHLQELIEQVSSTIQHNQDIHAPSSKNSRVEYYKGLLHAKKDSLLEDHSPAACLLTLAHEKALNLHYFRHCVTKFSDEFVEAVNQTFNIKSQKISLVQYI